MRWAAMSATTGRLRRDGHDICQINALGSDGGGIGHISLNAHMPEEGRIGTVGQATPPCGGVAGLGPNMGTHHLWWEEDREATLDRLALDGVVTVGGPDAVGPLEDLVVGTPAT